MFKITWSDQEVDTDSIDEVETVLDRVDRSSRDGEATLANVQRVDGCSLSIGLGRDLSVLSYVGADLNPPYLVSALPCDADGTIAFMFHGHTSEFSCPERDPDAERSTCDASVLCQRRAVDSREPGGDVRDRGDEW